MLMRMPSHCGDESCASCVVAGDFIFLAHHAGGHEKADIVYQTRATFEAISKTLASVGATLDDIVQINYYIKNTNDFAAGRNVFFEYFNSGFPARMTVVTEFLSAACLCQMDAIAYKIHS